MDNTSARRFQEVRIVPSGGEAATETRADYFAGESSRAIIFAPGAMCSKKSWHFLAVRFQERGIGSISLDSGSTPNLLNAVTFLKRKGVKKITMVGASAGGVGVLYTLQDNIDSLVDSVILLAPAGGAPICDARIKKLFIVAEDDLVSSRAGVYEIYKNSADPKFFKEYKGSEHAQHLFDSKYRENVIQLLINFIGN